MKTYLFLLLSILCLCVPETVYSKKKIVTQGIYFDGNVDFENRQFKEEDKLKNAEKANNLSFSLFGIPIGGNISTFNARLQKERCTHQFAGDFVSVHQFRGSLYGCNHTRIEVYYDDGTKQVYKVKVWLKDTGWGSILEDADKKYGVALKKTDKNLRVYENDKYSLFLNQEFDRNEYPHTFLTYINKDNFKQKIKNDLVLPSLNLNVNQFVREYSKKGKKMKNTSALGHVYKLDIMGRVAYLTIDTYDNGKISNVLIDLAHDHDSPCDEPEKEYESIVKNRIMSVYPNADKGDYGIFYLGDMNIRVFEESFDESINIKYIKVKESRPGGDI